MSVRAIAKKAGVSIATVSRVLNNEPTVRDATRNAVLDVAKSLNYVRGRNGDTATAIGFLYTSERTLAHPFDAAVLEGVARAAARAHCDVTIIRLGEQARRGSIRQALARKRLRGVIIRTTAATRDVCERIADEGIPHVVISERFDAPNVNFIDGESKAESMRALEYLIALGHRRIALATHNVNDRDHLDRLSAYREALERHDIAFEDRYVFRHRSSLAGGGTVMTMARAMPDPPTAIFCVDPALAIGVVKKAHEMGVRIPEDMSIVGFDDTDIRHSVHPTLTAVCQDAGLLGFEAARWLVRTAPGDADARIRKTIPTYLEINASTGPAKEP